MTGGSCHTSKHRMEVINSNLIKQVLSANLSFVSLTPRNDCVYTSQAPRWHGMCGMCGMLTRLPPKHKQIGM